MIGLFFQQWSQEQYMKGPIKTIQQTSPSIQTCEFDCSRQATTRCFDELVMVEKLHQTLQKMFHLISKHLKVTVFTRV